MIKIVITGPESSGKSTLASLLSSIYNSPIVEEYAVEYLTKTNGKYECKDLLKIAKGQITLENSIVSKSNNNLIICDTDLITIKIWSKVKFGRVSRGIMKTIRNRDYDYYLLCKPDIPWEFDEFRENPNDRDWLFTLYEKELIKYNKAYSIIEGNQQERIKIATGVIDKLR